MTEEELKAKVESARRHLTHFTEVTYAKYQRTKMHDIYTGVLNAFATGDVNKLIISMPPQHGKSEISSRRLPAFMLGLNPDYKIAVASYSQAFARKIGRDIRRIMKDKKYRFIFPQSRFADAKDKGHTNSADEAEIVDYEGGLVLAGRGAGLTGMPVDVLIMDDLYKNAEEANSPIIRESVIEWYKTVADTRLHNDSKQLIVFTRWHQEDLVGWLESQGLVDNLVHRDQLIDPDRDRWLKLNFPALKESPPYDLDPRQPGAALWPKRHSAHRLIAKKKQDEEVFESLYQGDPKPAKGMLYPSGFNEYDYLPEIIVNRWAYIDTADEGADYLCAICAVSDKDGFVYITDLIYTQESAEITEITVTKMLIDNNIDVAWIESNSGGRQFARNVERMIKESRGGVTVRWFHQSKNKEARIITNASTVSKKVYFQRGWKNKYKEFARDILSFKKLFKANKHDDAPDTLTGLVEYADSLHMNIPDIEVAGI